MYRREQATEESIHKGHHFKKVRLCRGEHWVQLKSAEIGKTLEI